MMKKPQDILAWALAEIEAGRLSAEDSLSAYPEVQRELDPVLQLALGLRPPDLPAAPVHLRQHVRVQLRQRLEAEERVAARSPSLAVMAWDMLATFGRPLLRVPESLRLVFCCVLAGVLLLASVHQAAANSLPGERTYEVKRIEESLTLAFARSPEAKARIHLALAARRLNEAHTLFRNGAENQAMAIAVDYSENIVKGLSYVFEAEVVSQADELREAYESAFLTYRMATSLSPHLWSNGTRTALGEAWEGFGTGSVDSNGESLGDDQGGETALPEDEVQGGQGQVDKGGQGQGGNGTQGQVDEGTQGQGGNGTQGQVDEGGQGQVGKGTQGQVDEVSQGQVDKGGQGQVGKGTQGQVDEVSQGQVDKDDEGDRDDSDHKEDKDDEDDLDDRGGGDTDESDRDGWENKGYKGGQGQIYKVSQGQVDKDDEGDRDDSDHKEDKDDEDDLDDWGGGDTDESDRDGWEHKGYKGGQGQSSSHL